MIILNPPASTKAGGKTPPLQHIEQKCWSCRGAVSAPGALITKPFEKSGGGFRSFARLVKKRYLVYIYLIDSFINSKGVHYD